MRDKKHATFVSLDMFLRDTLKLDTGSDSLRDWLELIQTSRITSMGVHAVEGLVRHVASVLLERANASTAQLKAEIRSVLDRH